MEIERQNPYTMEVSAKNRFCGLVNFGDRLKDLKSTFLTGTERERGADRTRGNRSLHAPLPVVPSELTATSDDRRFETVYSLHGSLNPFRSILSTEIAAATEGTDAA